MIARERIFLVLMLASTTFGFAPSNNNIASRRRVGQHPATISTYTSQLSSATTRSINARSMFQRRPSSCLAVTSTVGDVTNVTPATTSEEEQQQETTLVVQMPLRATADDDDDATSSDLDLQQKVINGLFLAASFGYALYTILDIDHGMTRGWSGQEIAMRIPLDNWGNYESCLENKPVFTKTLINVIIYLLGDWLSQTAFAGKNVLDFDIKRTLRNGFIGLCFGPLVHEYYQFSDAILPPEDGLLVRLQKILMDQTIYLTIKCSIYISAVGLLGGDDWPTVKQNVEERIGGVVVTAWKFWPFVHCITYGLIPAQHRILWVNSVDLIWNGILASLAQKQEPEDQREGEVVLTLESSAQVVGEENNPPSLEEEPSPLIVLDNRWVEDQKESVVEVFSSTLGGGASNNMTASDPAVA